MKGRPPLFHAARQGRAAQIVTPPDQHRWGPKLRRWHDAEARAERGEVGAYMTLSPFEVWRSREFLVQMFREGEWVRMSINRTTNRGGDWIDGITWDDLQRLKVEVGRGDQWAVEVYPAEIEVVNDANMRHLWLLSEAPPFAWTQAATQRTKGGDEAHRPCVTGESAATRGADAVRAPDPPTSDRARTERLASDPGVRHDEHDGGDDTGNVPNAGRCPGCGRPARGRVCVCGVARSHRA